MDALTHILTLYDTSPDMVFLCDGFGKVVETNNNVPQCLGYERSELLGINLIELSADGYTTKKAHQLLRRALHGEIVDCEWQLKTKSGATVHVEMRLKGLSDDLPFSGVGVIAVVRDITSRKKAEQALTSLAKASNILRFDEFLRDSVKILASVYNAKFAFIGRLVEPDNNQVRTLAVWAGDRFADNFSYALDGTPCKDILDLKEELIASDAIARYPDDDMLRQMGVDSYFGSPMISANHMIGLVSVMDTEPMTISDWSAPILNIFATRLAVEIERFEATQELQLHKNNLEQIVAERTTTVKEQAMILDQIHDSVVTTDLEGAVMNWNKGAEVLFGYSESEAIGQHISFVYPLEGQDTLLNKVIKPLQQNNQHEIEVRMSKKSGESFFAHLSLSLLCDEYGSAKGMIAYCTDISARKNDETLLKNSKRELEALNQELESFCYSVSHDLRAPLRAIDGFSQALLEDYSDNLDNIGKNYLHRVRNGALRMAELIDDLLQLSRVTRSEIQCEAINLSTLIHEVLQHYFVAEPHRNIDISVQPQMHCYGDKRLLTIVLDNLIGNAWKYTSKTEQAKIALGQQMTNDKTAFYIKDNGAGFDMQYADKLFGAFQRLHTETEFPGTGIGLATVQRIINRHGGAIWTESAVNQGTTFYFTVNAN